MALRQVSKCTSCQRYLSPTRLVSSPTHVPRPPKYVLSPQVVPRGGCFSSQLRANSTSSQQDNNLLHSEHSKDDCDAPGTQNKRLELQQLTHSLKNWTVAQQNKIDIASFGKFVAALNIELPKHYKRLVPSSMRMIGLESKSEPRIDKEPVDVTSSAEVAKHKTEREQIREHLYRVSQNEREQHDFFDAMRLTQEVTCGRLSNTENTNENNSKNIAGDNENTLVVLSKGSDEPEKTVVKSSRSNSLPAVSVQAEEPGRNPVGTVAGLLERLPNFTGLLSRNRDSVPDDKLEKKTEKKKKEVLKRPVVAKAAVDRRTRALVINVKQASSPASQLLRLEELCKHLAQHPDSKSLAVKEKVLVTLFRLRESSDKALAEQAREGLALLGHTDPVRGHGIRILSLDGGGTRGLMVIDMLKKMEELGNKEIHEMFDLICGVSTGALIAVLIGIYKVPLEECERIYKEFSKEMFSRHRLMGTSQLFLSHAYYDSKLWEDILRKNLGVETFLETTRKPDCCKVAAVSAIVNQATMQSFVFSNYTFPPGVHSHFPGSLQHHIWEAIRASSAAPGYFEEYKLGYYIHQDGGILTNNPTAIAIHEAKLLWPREAIQCVVSMGTGKHRSTEGPVPTYTLKDKINKIVQSATDTEAVHTILSDLLPPSSYYRINPYLSEDFDLAEIRPEKWDQMHHDVGMYMRKNEVKFQTVTQRLLEPRQRHQVSLDWLQHQANLLL